MRDLSIEGGAVLIDASLDSATVRVRGGSIELGEYADTPRSHGRIDATDLIVAPGLIDLQINGGFGIDLAAEPDRVWELGARLPECGVTSFLPTIISSPTQAGVALLDALKSRPASYRGAEPIGAHFEGPMISSDHLGAHQREHAQAITPATMAQWSRGGLTLVTLAPELPGALACIEALVQAGVRVSLGHSGATAEQALAGIAAGATVVTHLFNAMAPLHHREPNLVGVALMANEVTATLIVDGHHVDPLAVAIAMKAKGPSQLALVSDAMAAMGLVPGTYELGDAPVMFDGETVRTADGTLAGAAIGLDACVRNLLAFTGCSIAEALGCASAVPARAVAMSARGAVAAGFVADLTLFDHDLQPQVTICGGQVVYVADDARSRLDQEGDAAWK